MKKKIKSVEKTTLVVTDEEFMKDLNWDHAILKLCKDFLTKWDERPDSFYKGRPKYVKQADLTQREHLRNSIKYWEKKLSE